MSSGAFVVKGTPAGNTGQQGQSSPPRLRFPTSAISAGMSLVLKGNEPFDPTYIGLLAVKTEVLSPLRQNSQVICDPGLDAATEAYLWVGPL